MNEQMKLIKAAFPHTLPVMTGYLFLGTAYGIYMNQMGFSFLYPMLISIVVYAGSMQFVLVNLLMGAFAPMYAFLLTLMVNARHLFYGVGMLGRYTGVGFQKWYMIFGLTDETFSVNLSVAPPAGVDPQRFMYTISWMDQCYWVIGSTFGGILGSLVSFNTQGIDFVMTALFVVIFLEQWMTHAPHKPALIGVGASVLCLVIFGPNNFIVPAMLLILGLLVVFQRPLEEEENRG